MKGKTVKGFVVFLALAALCTAIGYHLSYPIKLNRNTLPEHIRDYYNRGRSIEVSPAIVLYGAGIGIGNKEYYLVEIGESMGSVTLERGLTGRYKITHLGYGDGNFLDGIIESSGQKYLLFGGRDMTAQISKITVLIQGQTYELYTEQARDRFLLYTEIDSRIEDNHVDRDKICFYNEMGEDITGLYNLSGGSIQ